MVVVKNILIGIYVIVCIALIILATIQTKESNGASGAVTGSASNNFYEKNKGNTREGKMKRNTIILTVVFAVLAIGLSILYQL